MRIGVRRTAAVTVRVLLGAPFFWMVGPIERAAGATPLLTAPVTIDGPDASISSLAGISVARDGSGGLIYLKSVGGTVHLFASVLAGGAFSPPAQIDGALAGTASQPQVAAGSNGLLLVAFESGGDLWVVTKPSATDPWGAPVDLVAGASSPALALSIHDKGYLAFTTGTPGANHVSAAYWQGSWSPASGPLDASSGGDAGAGAGRPAVTANGDGVGIVAWGEGGHIYTRRMRASAPSVAYQQVDPPTFDGAGEIRAGEPHIASADDSSYADVVFRETLATGAYATRDRIVFRRLRGPRYEAPVSVDGLAVGETASAAQPSVVLSPAARGFVTSTRTDTNALTAVELGGGGLPSGQEQLDASTGLAAPYAAPAITGDFSGLIAWQHAPGGIPAAAEIDARFFDGYTFGPGLVASDPALGPAAAERGLGASGDGAGDVAIGWTQGSGGAFAIAVARLFYPPGGFMVTAPSGYLTGARPTVAWSAARELWGPLDYTIMIDGRAAGRTSGTAFSLPSPLTDGRHTVAVTATNIAGQISTSPARSFFIDTVAPAFQVDVTGAARVGRAVRLRIRATDAPPPEPASGASGIASATVAWGDGTTTAVRTTAVHTYRRRGRARLRVTVRDRAGNATVVSRALALARGW